MRRATCGCCTNGCCCFNHQDVPRGRQPQTCEAHAIENAMDRAEGFKARTAGVIGATRAIRLLAAGAHVNSGKANEGCSEEGR